MTYNSRLVEKVDPRYDELDYELECEECHQPGALHCIDPYLKEVEGEVREVCLCNYCYQQRIEDIQL